MDANFAMERLSTIYQRGFTPEEAVEEAVSLYLALGSEIEALQKARDAAKQVISEVFVEIGDDRLDTAAGYAYVSKPSIRVSYDTKGLDKLCAERPDLASVLALYRSEKETAGVLTIRAGGK